MIAKAPIAFSAVFVFSIFIAWLFIWKVVVPEKNEQINTKQGTIEFLTQKLTSSDKEKNSAQNEDKATIKDLRNYIAGRSTSKSLAELMGFHDETNFVVVTNLIVSTNLLTMTVTNTVTQVVPQIISKRILNQEAVARIKSIIDSAPHVSIEITSPIGDGEAFQLAEQLKSIFESGGFSVNGVNQAIWSKPVTGLFLEVQNKEALNGVIGAGVIQIFKELGIRPEALIRTNMPDSQINFIVGSL